MPNLSHAIRKFNRFELKYLVSLSAAEKFKQALQPYLIPDEHSDGNGKYYLSSLYYDSPDYRFYWEKVEGIKFRRKLRLRWYENSNPLTTETPVFVEIKQRVDRVTQKRRAVLTYQEAQQLCRERKMPDQHASQDTAVLEEVVSLLWQYNLRPANVVRYARQALVGTEYDVGLRITFDTELSYHAPHLDLDDPNSCLDLFPPDWAVVEIKVNERIPYWLTELVAVHNLNLVRASKYCRSIELAQNLPIKA